MRASSERVSTPLALSELKMANVLMMFATEINIDKTLKPLTYLVIHYISGLKTGKSSTSMSGFMIKIDINWSFSISAIQALSVTDTSVH